MNLFKEAFMFGQYNFSNAVDIHTRQSTHALMQWMVGSLNDEFSDSIANIHQIIALTTSINELAEEKRRSASRLVDLDLYFDLFIDAVENLTTDMECVDLALEKILRDELNLKLQDLQSNNPNLPLAQVFFNNPRLKVLTENQALLTNDRLIRRFYSLIVECLSSHVPASNDRSTVRDVVNKLFEINFNLIQSITATLIYVRSKIKLEADEWDFLLNLASHLKNLHKENYLNDAFYNNINQIKGNITDQINMLALLRATSRLFVTDERRMTMEERCLLQLFMTSSGALIPGLLFLLKTPNSYINLDNRNIELANLVSLRVTMRERLETQIISERTLQNLMLNLQTTIAHAANLYSQGHISDKEFFHNIFHGKKGQRAVDNLMLVFNNDNIDFNLKMIYIITFLLRQRHNGGLRTNSFDTRFLTLLYNRNHPFGLFSIKLGSLNNVVNVNLHPTLEESQEITFSGLISPLLRGPGRFKRKIDRNVIRRYTISLFDNLRENVTTHNVELTQMRSMNRVL
jgi:hypothetical protein